MNLSMIYEQQENYHKVVEALKLAYWFTYKFLTQDEELWKLVEKRYKHPQVEEYKRYLQEIGELDRLIFTKLRDPSRFQSIQEEMDNDHFAKLNEYLYSKFNYETLNKSQFIFLKNNRAQSATNFFKSTRSDFTLDKTDRYLLDMDYERSSEISAQKSPGKDMIESKTFDDRKSGTKTNLGLAKDKKKKKEKYRLNQVETGLIENKCKLILK
jgi:hypothetical protein